MQWRKEEYCTKFYLLGDMEKIAEFIKLNTVA